LYFTIVFRVVVLCDRRIQGFENCRAVWIKQLFDGTGADDDAQSLRAFKLWRGHFSKGCVPVILNWRDTKSKTFSEVMTSLKVEKDFDALTLEDLQDSFSARFSFCSYLCFSLGSCVLEVVNVTHETWLSIIFLKVFYAVLHRVGKIPLVQIAPFFCLIAFVFIFSLYCVTHSFMRSLCCEEVQRVRGLGWLPGFINRMSEYCNPQEIILTCVQVLLFFLCHSWAGYMISKSFWEGAFRYGDADKIMEAIIYPFVLCVLAMILPRLVPDFAIVMSLPPFFSHKNERVLQLVCVQVVDQEMVRARSAVKKRMGDTGRGSEGTRQRLRSIYHGTPTLPAVHKLATGMGNEADDTIIQPFLDHNPVIQAQQVHKTHVKRKTKVQGKIGSGSGASGKKLESAESKGKFSLQKTDSNPSNPSQLSGSNPVQLKKNVLGKVADNTE